MYIDTVPNRNSPPAILLRESYRENGKVKKRTLANVTKLPAHIIELIRQALAGPIQVVGESLCGAVFGVLFVLNELALQCGLQRALGHSRLARLTLFLVLARIAHQGSRLSAVRWAREHAVKAVLGLGAFDEEDLYQALDWAAAQQEVIEARLYRDYVKRTGESPALVLYDVTSSYFEGEHNAQASPRFFGKMSQNPKDTREHTLLNENFGESLHQGPQPPGGHIGDQLIEHAALTK
jgi:hypothetical protein